MQWINVHDKLPDDGRRVLIITANKLYDTGAYSAMAECWFLNNDRLYDEIVTHWMPLPEPPKEQK